MAVKGTDFPAGKGTGTDSRSSRAESRRIFRDFVDATATIRITAKHIHVHFQKRAHNPLLVAAGFEKTDLAIPWLAGKRLAFTLG